MTVLLLEIFRILFVPFLCLSCIIFTLVTAEHNNLGEIQSSNNSVGIMENETVTEKHSSEPIVPPLVIHGKVNSVIHEIHGSIEDIPLLLKTDIKPDEHLSPATNINFSSSPLKDGAVSVEQRLVDEVTNLTAPEVPATEAQVNVSAGGAQDDIPSFSEWAKKHMEEAGRTKGENLTVGSGGAKLRFKNYASPDCGAKVVASNPEAVSPSAILSSTRDDYMLNPCNVKIWFVVELCEPIQPQRIEIANFELFSSSPQELSVYTSDRFPTREWAQTGALMARDERTVQSFPLPRASHFVKYLKVELHSHYGSEHFCPISLFRAYGTSEIEVLETVDGEEADAEEGDELVGGKRDLLEELEVKAAKEHSPDSSEAEEDEKTNLFGSAKAAVMSIVKKAAEVLVKTPGNQSTACGQGGPFDVKQCFTPGYQIVCTNCSDNFYSKLFEVLCCHGSELQCLLSNSFVNSVLSETQLCNEIGIAWNETSSNNTTAYSPKAQYLKAFLPREMIAALCNYLAVTKKRVNINTTHEELAKEEPNKQQANDTFKAEHAEEPKQVELESPEIQPSKVVEDEKPTFTVESNLKPEEAAAVVETATVAPEVLQLPNDTDTSVPSAPVNETTEKAPTEETNITQPVVETKKQPAENEEPAVDTLSLDSLFPESEEEPLGKGKPDEIVEQEETKTTVTVQKESVFVRLANKIKALEMNMSLSSQYLEELSRRYKKQVEELQRNLNSVLEERRLAAERESVQAVQLAALTSKVEALTLALGELITERDSWSSKVLVLGQHGLIVVLEVIGFAVVVWIWRRLGPSPSTSVQKPVAQQTPHLSRRHSAEEVRPRTSIRRPSEEACLPSGGTHLDLMSIAPKRKVSREGARKRKRRRKGGEVVVIGSHDDSWRPLEPVPDIMRAATWKRSSQTQTSLSQEQLSISSDNSSSKPKKTGAFRKIVKKLF